MRLPEFGCIKRPEAMYVAVRAPCQYAAGRGRDEIHGVGCVAPTRLNALSPDGKQFVQATYADLKRNPLRDTDIYNKEETMKKVLIAASIASFALGSAAVAGAEKGKGEGNGRTGIAETVSSTPGSANVASGLKGGWGGATSVSNGPAAEPK
jgi:hypothetical protein